MAKTIYRICLIVCLAIAIMAGLFCMTGISRSRREKRSGCWYGPNRKHRLYKN